MTPEMKSPDHEWERELEVFLDAVDDGSLSHAEQLPLARRFAWEGMYGKRIPSGHWLRHECGQRSCINPDHAILVPADESGGQ